MAPVLYMLPGSPAVRSVLICAKALGLELELNEVDLFKGEHLTPEYLAINPQHTVPTLVDDDGFIVWDSHAIMPYLVTKYGKDESLYPADPKKRAIVDQRLHFDSGVLFAKGITVTRTIIHGGAKEVTEDGRKSVAETFVLVEKFLENKKWVAGDELTIADFSFASSITSWSIFETITETKYPRLATWLKQMETLPYFKEANKGVEQFYQIINKLLS